MPDTRRIRILVNGASFEGEAETRCTLADFLRNQAGLTGTHVGCEHGVCGVCTVLIDGKTARSCLLLAAQAEGHEITTIEGVAAPDGTLHPLQVAMSRHHGLQCGFCTPGVLMTLIELLRDNPDPTDEEIRDVLSGNLCRCTGYQGMVNAALDAARQIRTQGI